MTQQGREALQEDCSGLQVVGITFSVREGPFRTKRTLRPAHEETQQQGKCLLNSYKLNLGISSINLLHTARTIRVKQLCRNQPQIMVATLMPLHDTILRADSGRSNGILWQFDAVLASLQSYKLTLLEPLLNLFSPQTTMACFRLTHISVQMFNIPKRQRWLCLNVSTCPHPILCWGVPLFIFSIFLCRQ